MGNEFFVYLLDRFVPLGEALVIEGIDCCIHALVSSERVVAYQFRDEH